MKIKTEWHGLTLVADIISDDWEGDPSVPNGVHHLPPYAQDIDVLDADGFSLLDYISEKGMEEIETALLEAWDGDSSFSGSDSSEEDGDSV